MLVKGFTLIELLVVIAILGILYAIALPAYNQFIQDGRRADVQQSLLQHVAILERKYTRQGQYPLSTSYSIPATDYYTFNYSSAQTTFELKAIPKVNSAQENDACDTLSVNHRAVKSPDRSGCWGK